jgi:hypothetical protein
MVRREILRRLGEGFMKHFGRSLLDNTAMVDRENLSRAFSASSAS